MERFIYAMVSKWTINSCLQMSFICLVREPTNTMSLQIRNSRHRQVTLGARSVAVVKNVSRCQSEKNRRIQRGCHPYFCHRGSMESKGISRTSQLRDEA